MHNGTSLSTASTTAGRLLLLLLVIQHFMFASARMTYKCMLHVATTRLRQRRGNRSQTKPDELKLLLLPLLAGWLKMRMHWWKLVQPPGVRNHTNN